MEKYALTLFAFLFLSVSCHKTHTDPASSENPITTKIDTIKPSEYLSTYPGSWWKYIDKKGDTIIYKTSDSYQKDSYSYTWSKSNPFPSTITETVSAYVPLYNKVPIWGGYGHTGPYYNYGQLEIQPLVAIAPDEFKPGQYWPTYVNSHYDESCRILAVDSTVIIEGKSYYPTMVIEKRLGYNDAVLSGKDYYTRGIGLVKRITIAWTSSVASGELRLVAYHINK